jgi:hypothetical protein
LPTGVLSSAILGDLILSVGGDGGFTVLSYDFNSRLINTLFQAPGSAAIDQVFTVNDQRFVARHKDGTLSLWSLDATNQRIEKINELAAAADAVAVHPGGDYVVALNNRGVHFYNLPNFKLRSTNNATTNNVTPNNVTTSLPKSVAFNTSGNRMALADRDGVLVWDMTSNRLVERLYTNDAPLAFAISPDGATMAWSNASNDIVLWPVEESAAPIPLSGHVEAVYQLEFSPDGTLLVSADALGGVKLWDVAQQRQITNLELHRDTLTSFAISPEGETLLSATISGDMAVTSLSLPSWINATCRILDRNMTPDEWKRFGFGEYKQHCDTVQKIPPPNTTPPAKPQAPPKPIVVSKGYDVVEDATGTISVMVPSQWKARDIGPLANGGLLYSRIRAAPSMQEYLDMQGPGLDFALLKLDKPETVNLRSLLELVMEQSSRCDNWAGNSIFNNAMFSGTMSFMRPCGTTGLTEVWLAARTSNNVIIIGSLAVTGDEDAWVHIINAMNSLKTL